MSSPSSAGGGAFGGVLAAGAAGRGVGAADWPEDTSRTKPSLSSCWISASNLSAESLSNLAEMSESGVLPSTAASTARSARDRWLVLPEASCTPLPVFEKIARGLRLLVSFGSMAASYYSQH